MLRAPFTSSAKSSGEKPEHGERRSESRVDVLDEGGIAVPLDFERGSGVLLNVSRNGMMIHALNALDVGTALRVTLWMPESATTVTADTKVLWIIEDGRAGLRLPSIPERWVECLKELSKKCRSSVETSAPVGLTDSFEQTTVLIESPTTSLARDTSGRPSVESLAEDAQSLTRAEGVAVALNDDSGISCQVSQGNAPPVGTRLQLGEGISGECFRTGRVINCFDTDTDPRIPKGFSQALNVRSIAIVPVLDRSQVVGLLEVFSSRPAAFDTAHIQGLVAIAEQVAAKLSETASYKKNAP